MWRSTHPPSTCTQSTSASPLPQPLPAEKEEATKKGKAGAPKSLREGGPQHQVGDPGPLGPQGKLSRPVGLSSLQTALVKYRAHRTRCLPALAKSPSQFGPLGTSPVSGRPGLYPRDQAGLGWAFGGGLLGEFVPSFLNSAAAGRE